jgi:hypothetical protein
MNFETHYLSHCRVKNSSKFRKSYTLPAARIVLICEPDCNNAGSNELIKNSKMFGESLI